MTDYEHLAGNLGTPVRLDSLSDSDFRDPFPLDALPVSVRDRAVAVADSIRVPTGAAAAIGLAVLSAAVGPCEVRLLDEWISKDMIWALVVAEPGMRKSPLLNAMGAPAKDAQALLRAIWMSERPERQKAVKQAEAQVEAAEKAFDEAPSDLLREQARNLLVAAQQQLADAESRLGHLPNLITRDATPEALCDHLSEQDRVLALIPEGDAVVGRLTRKEAGSAAIWLHSKAGESFTTRLRVRGEIHVEAPYLSATAMVQSVVLRKMLSDKTLEGGGFLDRWMVVSMPRPLPRRWADMKAASSDPAARRAAGAWTRTVVDSYLSTFGLRGEGHPLPQLVLSPEAEELWAAEFDNFDAEVIDSPGPRPGAAFKIDNLAIRVAALRAMERAITHHVQSVRASAKPAVPVPGPPIAVPTIPTRTLLDTSTPFSITAADIAAGWQVAWWSYRRLGDVFGEQMSEDGKEIELRIKTVHALRRVAESDEPWIVPRRLQQKVRDMDVENMPGLLDDLALAGWLVVDQPTYRHSTWKIYPRPDIGVWLDKFYPAEPKGAPA